MRSWQDKSGLSDDAWQAVKRGHARLLRAEDGDLTDLIEKRNQMSVWERIG